MPDTFNLAIVGGGIASLCLAHALTANKPSQWTVRVFEASVELRDEGAAIGLGSNAQTALSLISPELRATLDEAGGTRMDPSVRIMMATGPDSGRHIGDIRPKVAQIVVHRGKFWRALAAKLPDGVLAFGKRLDGLESSGEHGKVTLRFEDGSTYEADAVVGCDGINSRVRKFVLGEQNPAATPKFTRGYNHRVVISLEEAKKAFGEEYCRVVAGWSKGEIWRHRAPFVEWSKDRFRDDIRDWGDIGRAMTKVFTELQPKLFAAGGRLHIDTPTYFKGVTCVAGDAALSFPPFQGAGAGQAIEDALALSTTLGTVSVHEDIPKVLKIYDELRRPRRKAIAESSAWAAQLFTGTLPGVGLDIERIAAELPTWGDNIYNVDLAKTQREALERATL